ncbi:OmpA family protein [Burkholderia plantarii]|uniref:OmpA family protein n=1 Tax=Burkholderia plantarii TaxID=41899 RepID=UPI001F5B958A|nr:OmpA family protein [Burkholderia plantarii]
MRRSSTSAGAPAHYGQRGDEALALRRALSARSYLVARGVSPLKIMVNFASAADFVADNSTAEGRRENQRVDIEVVYIPTY